ncbi:type IX secretion system membrane protein PorP/SprF [Flavobacterium sp. HSC-61S13]|uniref:PorP/SprF family type IX secretion system membrane protein n=1 Tax=Flavobacterium sp. HSC-61S13 TaxID=2910963 RepID=UPI0020A1F3E1|nr:type IX secretion system membrane protein PorP/SprF [Flavobacterium sp. HSC-61S13]MCP1997470.1 type IX secretion system PorP/SprF family membrane protein [Flavobacterium sp. HSC-61S13]
MKITDKIKGLALGILFLGVVFPADAQQDPQYTQYMYNTINVNPAYAGSRGVMSVFGMYRTQWVGLDGAPKTANISVHTPLGDSRLGLGVSFINDHIGAMDENNISADLSYTIDLDKKFKLSFGIKATANLLNVDYSKLDIYDPNDVMFQENISSQFSPNIGAGLYLHSDKTYVGLSVPNFLETDRYDDNDVTTMKQKMNFFLIGGHVFDLSPSLKLKPAFLVKGVQGAPLQVDVSANFMIQEKFVVGAAYRWDAAFSGLLGFQVTDGLFIGYAYDAETTKLAHYNSGSHEIFLRFELFNRFNRITTPRFF